MKEQGNSSPRKANNSTIKASNSSDEEGIVKQWLQNKKIKMMNEFKRNMYKQRNEFKQNTNKQINSKIIQQTDKWNEEDNARYERNIQQRYGNHEKNKIDIFEMKRSISQIKSTTENLANRVEWVEK
jgi:hypothetical protein